MTLLSARQKLVASNLANIDTPGYKTRDIDFHQEFMSQLDQSAAQTNVAPKPGSAIASAMRADASRPQVIEPDLASRNDGNNVSLDRETRLLAEIGMRFQMASLLTRGRIKMIKEAIQEGRGG